MLTLKRFIFICLCGIWLYISPALAVTHYGYVEKAYIQPGNLVVKAKLDTGAVLASIDAVHVTRFKKEGETWIRFEVPQENKNLMLERKLIRYVNIKTRSGERKAGLFQRHVKRPVVLLTVTIGNKTKTIEVNLANRRRFIYPLLLGREALIAFDASVNPAMTFTQKLKTA